ncbi:hypothetical protein P5673_000950, partial [Acropora cervicornis]
RDQLCHIRRTNNQWFGSRKPSFWKILCVHDSLRTITNSQISAATSQSQGGSDGYVSPTGESLQQRKQSGIKVIL